MTERLQRTLRIPCSVSHAFTVFTERIDQWWPRGHRRFEDSELHFEPRVGGRFYERRANGEEAQLGEVLRYEPPHHVSYTWYPGAPDSPTHVAISFSADGAETVVDVVHSEGEHSLGDAWPDRAHLFERGWQKVLGAFELAITKDG